MIYYREFPKEKEISDTLFAQEVLLYACRKEYGFHTLPIILRTERGKPFFQDCPEIFFNYSHSREAVACVVSNDEIGIDLEEFRPISERLSKRICHENEWNFIRNKVNCQELAIMIWTMKEAYLKKTGTGIREKLSGIDFSELLENEGNGYFEGYLMQVHRMKNGYLSVYAKEQMDIQYVAQEDKM